MTLDGSAKNSAKSKNNKASQPIPKQDVVAAFDFDGTITTRDSLVPFLFFLKGPWKAIWHFLSIAPYLILFPLGFVTRQAAKEKILTRFLGGMPVDELRTKGREYAASKLENLVKPEALQRIEWHRQQGHRCVVVSASVDLYLTPWAEQHGIDDVVASRLGVDSQGLVTGKLQGKNCWGEEKVHRLLEVLGSNEQFYLYAYGDSRGDSALLAMADKPFYCCFCK